MLTQWDLSNQRAALLIYTTSDSCRSSNKTKPSGTKADLYGCCRIELGSISPPLGSDISGEFFLFQISAGSEPCNCSCCHFSGVIAISPLWRHWSFINLSHCSGCSQKSFCSLDGVKQIWQLHARPQHYHVTADKVIDWSE